MVPWRPYLLLWVFLLLSTFTGPYNSVRGMADGDLVKIDNAKKK